MALLRDRSQGSKELHFDKGFAIPWAMRMYAVTANRVKPPDSSEAIQKYSGPSCLHVPESAENVLTKPFIVNLELPSRLAFERRLVSAVVALNKFASSTLHRSSRKQADGSRIYRRTHGGKYYNLACPLLSTFP